MRSVFSDNTRDIDPYLTRAVHSARLERWIGTEEAENISLRMRDWYGPPIPVAGVPGRVYACGGGDFCGRISGGQFANMTEYAVERYKRAMRRAWRRAGRSQGLHAGFASLSDLISEMTTGGKKQVLPYNKTGVTQPATGAGAFLWRQGVLPSAGSNAAVAPGGTAFTSASTGALKQVDAASGDTLHFINWYGAPTQAQTSTLMLFDYLFGVNIDYNSTSNSVTGVPTRYQTSTTAPGNFMSGNVTTALGATAQNITVTYVNDAGTTGKTSPATAIRASAGVDTIPHTAPVWNVPLAAGDTGIRSYTTIAFSATNSGNVDRLIGHPIALLPALGVANQGFLLDGINSAANFERIYDGACLAFMEWFKSATTACSYNGYITLCSG